MNLDKLIPQLRQNNKPFWLTFSGSKKTVITTLGKFEERKNNLSVNELILVNKVKSFVNKNVDYKNIFLPDKIKYVDYGFFLELRKTLLNLI